MRDNDVIVVGGGPAGLMAAGRAAELGAKVMLIEKTYRIGSKLLITGGGRCNITNNAGTNEFIEAFGANGEGEFLYRALSLFSNKDLIAFFSARGLEMRTDPDGKIFPVSDSAESVLAVLRAYVKKYKVFIIHNSVVSELLLSQDSKTVAGIKLQNGETYATKNVIIATGGLSYPKTGSTGDGYALAKQCGHTIIPTRAALVPLESDEGFIKELQGITLKDLVITLMVEGKTIASEQGDLLFTHFGVSGPKVLILSGKAVDALAEGNKAELSLNFKHQHNTEELERILQTQWLSCGNKTFRNFLNDSFPESFAEVFEERCGMKNGIKCSAINRDDRKRIAKQFTDFRIQITKPRPIEEATITGGGVNLSELNPQTMESKLVKGLYFCGEVIDLDGITGGYNLQEAFSTGYLAGESAFKHEA